MIDENGVWLGDLQIWDRKDGTRQIGFMFASTGSDYEKSQAAMKEAAGKVRARILQDYSSMDSIRFLPMECPIGLEDPPFLGEFEGLLIARCIWQYDAVNDRMVGRCDVRVEPITASAKVAVEA